MMKIKRFKYGWDIFASFGNVLLAIMPFNQPPPRAKLHSLIKLGTDKEALNYDAHQVSKDFYQSLSDFDKALALKTSQSE